MEARLRHWHQKASEALAKRREESKVEDQTSTKSVSASAAIRHQPEVRRWEDIEISFLSDERVEIRIGSQIETRNYAEMGFEDQRTGKPNEAWSLLKGLAELKGEISRDELSGKHLERFTKRIERTRRVLRKHFGMTDDPVPYTQGVGYRARFKIQLAVAYKT